MSNLAQAFKSDPITYSDRIDHILVATKTNSSMIPPLERAALIAEQCQSTVNVLHIIDPDTSGKEKYAMQERLSARIRHSFRYQQPSPKLALVPYSYHMDDPIYGVVETLAKIIHHQSPQLVILGNTTQTPLPVRLRGSLAMQMIATTNTPVLITTTQGLKPYRKVLITTDLKGGHDAKVQHVLSLAPEAEIQIVHICPEQHSINALYTDEKEGQKKFLSGISSPHIKASMHQAFETGQATMNVTYAQSPHQALHNLIARAAPDLLVFATRAHTGLQRIILGSFAQRYIDQPPCDILAVHKAQ